MLSLESTKWAQLEHAYGPATDIPDLLRQLESLPSSQGEAEPWFSIWSALAHQGDVYSASFAAVPHVVKALKKNPEFADSTYFQFPAWVEICRHKKSVGVPSELKASYLTALSELPGLVAATAGRDWDSAFLCCAMSAIAASKGHPSVAEAALELDSKIAEEFMEWFYNR